MRIFILLFVCSMLFSTCCQCLELTVNIVGVDATTKQILETNLTISQATTEPKLTIIRVQNLHSLATQQLSDTLEAIGFYHATITPKLTCKKEHWIATYKINKGNPILINQVTLVLLNKGAHNKTLFKALKTTKLQKGSVLKHADYEETKQNLLGLLQEHGYLAAKFTKHEININTALYKADIELTINTGEQYVFGQVTFIDCLYSTELLDRFIPFKQGEPYTSKSLAAFRKNLTDSAMFKKIKIMPKPKLADPKDIKVPIAVFLQNSPLNHYSSNIGYGTNTGIRGSVGWQHRIVSPAGHQISNFLTVSKIRKQATINYMIPGKRPGSDRYIIGTGFNQETIRDQYSQQKEISFTKANKVDDRQSYWSLKYVDEHFRIASTMPKEYSKFILPGARWIWTKPKGNEETFAHGTRLELALRGGLGKLFSHTDFAQTEIQAKWIALINSETRVILMGDIGSTAIKSIDTLPLSLRFFAGGDKSIRGFAYHALGPTQLDSYGNHITIGGKYLLVTTIELERKLNGKLSGAIFADTGNAMNTWNTKFAAGAGVGIRWATPIGAFKIDVAKQIAQIQENKFRLHLSFGMDL